MGTAGTLSIRFVLPLMGAIYDSKKIEIAERFVRTVRSECLDWLLIGGAHHLERALTVFIEHYNGHRAHRSLGLAPPSGRPVAAVVYFRYR